MCGAVNKEDSQSCFRCDQLRPTDANGAFATGLLTPDLAIEGSPLSRWAPLHRNRLAHWTANLHRNHHPTTRPHHWRPPPPPAAPGWERYLGPAGWDAAPGWGTDADHSAWGTAAGWDAHWETAAFEAW